MSGHSKWATIHRKKGLIDAARGKVFQKLAKELYVAAKSGTPDPDSNASLRLVVEKAKAANMPKDNIQKAIDKAKGAGNGENYESIRYEGYGPGGVAIMVDCLTDNRNRTASMVRSTFSKRGGNLGTDGSVSYIFERKGIIVIPSDYDEDEVMLTALDAGALDMENNGDTYLITTPSDKFIAVKDALANIGVAEFLTSEVTFVPNNEVELDDETKEKVYNLIEALEDIDDVGDVHHNMKED
ncbi:MAG TPA: YebC/PmpR family DNA-binding transcriptional regulator [Candidatus Onthousia excrementipullorum]|uniref:Probable transcriptional regulatory protein IAB38_04810 n=1 Tax=Candidatus Onthousia excrementipullorum TaxID=2840884 RepID=A0A9D1DUL6_9FIRM|nr:YebC/PmpR family DNA-binding transcriptional regulator [Candidatus Onthousia excrementipullorum]